MVGTGCFNGDFGTTEDVDTVLVWVGKVRWSLWWGSRSGSSLSTWTFDGTFIVFSQVSVTVISGTSDNSSVCTLLKQKTTDNKSLS